MVTSLLNGKQLPSVATLTRSFAAHAVMVLNVSPPQACDRDNRSAALGRIKEVSNGIETDQGVTIGEDANTVRLSHAEWNELVGFIKSGKRHEV